MQAFQFSSAHPVSEPDPSAQVADSINDRAGRPPERRTVLIARTTGLDNAAFVGVGDEGVLEGWRRRMLRQIHCMRLICDTLKSSVRKTRHPIFS
ncbi:unnamed protein product [Protopolystoma xenopodis]|uniref:Uncharacterized protein n=1 Tax=Protopolystoma xenopodis TaxID=117903 RepID=A0A3S5A2I5_9PLAT|nr:unnamed protein product [Protopolystoma xenopodis]